MIPTTTTAIVIYFNLRGKFIIIIVTTV